MMRGDLMTAQRAKCDLCSVYVSLDPPGLPTCTAAHHPQRLFDLLLSGLSISFSQRQLVHTGQPSGGRWHSWRGLR